MIKLRNATIITTTIMVVLAVIFGIIGTSMPEYTAELITLIVAVGIALGLFAQTGQTPQKLTWAVFLAKFKSPVLWGSLVALFSFMVTIDLGAGVTDILRIGIIVCEGAVLILAQWNDPNNQLNYR